jgi:hypothetical protein
VFARKHLQHPDFTIAILLAGLKLPERLRRKKGKPPPNCDLRLVRRMTISYGISSGTDLAKAPIE